MKLVIIISRTTTYYLGVGLIRSIVDTKEYLQTFMSKVELEQAQIYRAQAGLGR